MFTVHSGRSRREGHPSSKRSRIVARVPGAGVAITVAVTGLGAGVAQAASAPVVAQTASAPVAATYTTVTHITHVRSGVARSVPISATVQATAGTPTVNEGTVMFNVAGQSGAAYVSNGRAMTFVTLPADLPDGTYGIYASYHDYLGRSFGPSTGFGILTVGQQP